MISGLTHGAFPGGGIFQAIGTDALTLLEGLILVALACFSFLFSKRSGQHRLVTLLSRAAILLIILDGVFSLTYLLRSHGSVERERLPIAALSFSFMAMFYFGPIVFLRNLFRR